MTESREICSRLLNPDNPDHRDYFNEDADMAQRAMIQILFLDKGRLTGYRIGKYEKNDRGFYLRVSPKKPWSTIADEIWNVDRFVLSRARAQCSYSLTERQVETIWNQYALMIAAGRLTGAINQTAPAGAYATYRATAVTQSGLVLPDPYGETNLLDGVCRQEGTGAGVATHCYALHGSLYWNSVKIGEQNSATGDHTFTDAGLGWGSVQPYKAGARNLYHPQFNMTRVAEILKGYHADAAAVPGDKSRIWHAVFGYHHGSMQTDRTPAWLRTNQPEPAGYADAVFNKIGAPFTPLPTTNNDD